MCFQAVVLNHYLNNLYNKIETGETKDIDLFKEAMNVLSSLYANFRNSSYPYTNLWNTLKNRGFKLLELYEGLNGSKAPFIQNYLLKQTGIQKIVPKCIVYKENPIGNSALSTSNISDLENAPFFKALFKMMGVDTKTVQNAYNQFSQNMNIQCLKKMQKDVQKKLDKISAKFNDLYFASDDQYKFTIEFESNRVFFGMARGKDEDAINLEYQSTGFRWFFNLFFNFLATYNLEPGDIVIMDEPATNLHVQGQNELRAFIKQFAIENYLSLLPTHLS